MLSRADAAALLATEPHEKGTFMKCSASPK
jgi:hypothetical protein